MRMPALSSRPMLLILALGACLAVGYSAAGNRAVAPSGPAVVATVDLEALFNGLAERASENSRLDAMAQQVTQEQARRRKEAEDLQKQLQGLQPGTDEYRAIEGQLEQKAIELQAWTEFQRRKIDQESGLVMARLYKKIKTAVAAVADAEGYDVVTVNDSLRDLQPSGGESAVLQQISLRRLLYTNPQLDITQDLLTKMNNEFTNPQG